MRRTLDSKFEVVASKLEIPWSMEFSPDGDLFFTERIGRLNVIVNGKIRPLLHLKVDARMGDESGLLGLTIDPEFNRTRLIYTYYSYKDEKKTTVNRVSRFIYNGDELLDERVIIDEIPGGRVHDGGRIKFGPDGKLYITTGETWKRELAQKLDFLGGKILRINRDGTIPADNPFPHSPVYSYGNRNPQGLAWHPITKALFSSEHGPSGENGWYANDKINIIESGKNYGWPLFLGAGNDPRYVDPLYDTGDDTWAPSGTTFYIGEKFPKWNNALFIACLRGEQLQAITLKPPDYDEIEFNVAFFEGELGRLRDVVQGPDGYLYLCTSNRDGRGRAFEDDDFIVKVKSLT